MKLRPNSWLPLLVAVLLLAGLGILVYKTSLGDSGQRAQVNLDLRDLKEIDAEWSLDVLRSKNDINKNYDPINGPLQALASNQDRLDTLATQIDASSLRGPVDALKKSLTEKIDLIDSFKMQNALLKNSLRFLPTAVVQLQEQVRLARQAYDKATKPGTAKPLDDLERIADKVLTGILNYGLSSDPGVRADVQGLLSELASSRVTQPGKVAAQIDTLVNHSQVVLRQKGIEDGVLLAIAKVPTVSNINALADSFEKIFRAKAQTQGQWRQGLVVYSIGLLALLMFSAFKLFESYRSLNEANSRLEKANVTLEDRVQLRTSELSDALNILKESQVQLFQAEKMASLGQMVAGIAHEINTPLAYVKNSVQIAHARMKDVKVLVDESAKLMVLIAESDANQKLPKVNFEVLSEVTSTFVETDSINELDVLLGDGLYGIDQISEIVLNLKNFSRLDRSHVDLHDINSGVETTLKIAQNIVKRRMISKFFGDVPLIQCSPSQINQVLLNLITNACQATSDDGGKVAIITKRYRDGLIVQVVDNGHGIPPEAKTKIFDPFFTTKKVGEGTGLGLSIVQRIVKEHGGRISVSSQVGRGTGFTVYLPEKQALEMVGQQA